MKVNQVVQTGDPQDMPRMKVTLAEIQEVKHRHILENLSYTPEEAGAIFSKSAKWAIERVKDGKLIAVDENAKKVKGQGLRPSQGIRITALSITHFRQEFEIAPEQWAE